MVVLYAVVEFIKTKSSAIIPTNWYCNVEESHCYWPGSSTLNKKINHAVENKKPPSLSWKKYEVRTLGKAATYKRAEQKLKRSYNTSDIGTDAGTDEIAAPSKRVRRSNPKYVVFDESTDSESDPVVGSDDDLPPPPANFSLPHASLSPIDHSKSARNSSLPVVSCVIETGASISRAKQKPAATPGNMINSSEHCFLSQAPQSDTEDRCFVSNNEEIEPQINVQERQQPSAAFNTENNHLLSSTLAMELSNVQATEQHASNASVVKMEHLLLQVLKNQEEIKATQKIRSSMLSNVMKKMNSPTEELSKLPEGVSFPIKNVDEFKHLEAKLEDPIFTKGIVSVLSDMGGKDLDDMVRRVMSYVMTNDVALQFNFIGRLGKKAFRDTHTYDSICDAIKRHVLTKQCSRDQVEKSVSKWLRGSRDRDGKRALRAEAARAAKLPAETV